VVFPSIAWIGDPHDDGRHWKTEKIAKIGCDFLAGHDEISSGIWARLDVGNAPVR
jgi:hypothetical protein